MEVTDIPALRELCISAECPSIRKARQFGQVTRSAFFGTDPVKSDRLVGKHQQAGRAGVSQRPYRRARLTLQRSSETTSIRSTMTRLYFLCPNTRRWFSMTFEKVPPDGPIKSLFTINRCRHCESVHRYKGSEARRSRPASQPNPKFGLKAKPKKKIFVAHTKPLSFAAPN
jgi:hypothetical protein